MIDVQRLRILRAVAEHGSFNKAAGALRLTPRPSLSTSPRWSGVWATRWRCAAPAGSP